MGEEDEPGGGGGEGWRVPDSLTELGRSYWKSSSKGVDPQAGSFEERIVAKACRMANNLAPQFFKKPF